MYTEYHIDFKRDISEEESDIVIALLSQEEFESFQVVEGGVKAYVQTNLIDLEAIEAISTNIKELFELDIKSREMEDINWNEEWEKDYEPVFVSDNCVIKAPFHNISPKLE